MLSPEEVEMYAAKIKEMRDSEAKDNEIIAKAQEQNQKTLNELTKFLQELCPHTTSDGASAIKKLMFNDECQLCGKEW